MHLCPAVPTAPKRIALSTNSILASSITIIALLPPNSRMHLPNLLPTTSPMRCPILQLPVALISLTLWSLIKLSPIVAPRPTIREKTAFGISFFSITFWTIFVTAIAVRGAFEDGFHIIASPQTEAIKAFQAHTATGKLKDVIIPIVPSGCHCSYILCLGLSECIAFP